jgi:hypothetical protein
MINTLTYKRASTTIVAKQTTNRVEPRMSAAPFSSGFEGMLAGSMIADVKNLQERPQSLGTMEQRGREYRIHNKQTQEGETRRSCQGHRSKEKVSCSPAGHLVSNRVSS